MNKYSHNLDDDGKSGYRHAVEINVRESVLVTLSLVRFRTLGREQLVKIEMHHGHKAEEVEAAITDLLTLGKITEKDGFLFQPPEEEKNESIPQAYLDAADRYRKSRAPKPFDKLTVWLAGLWHKIWGGLILLIATAFIAIGLSAEEMPAWVIPGIAP
jgi:hypothetical protein